MPQSGWRTKSALVLALLFLVIPGDMGPVQAGSGVNEEAGWIVPCTLSHSLEDDPIVSPGQPGAAHLHDFFGGRRVDAHAKYKQVVAGGTSCSNSSGDTGGYWTPALYLDSTKVDPAGSFEGREVEQKVYFRGNNLAPGTQVRTIPRNLRIIAGNSKATSVSDNPQLGQNLYFGCSDNSTGKLTQPPVCSTGILSVHIGFPNCWDGVRRDARDHQSHMAYPNDEKCPRSHPVALPRVIMRLEYPVGTGGGAITLASGAPYTLHGDFWNTWRQPRLNHFVATCLNAGVNCKKI
jgi:hypothetical protein